jgi:hypothetical protein
MRGTSGIRVPLRLVCNNKPLNSQVLEHYPSLTGQAIILPTKIMRSQSILAVAFAALAAAAPAPQTPDQPIELFVDIWKNQLNCPKPSTGTATGANDRILGSGCLDHPITLGSSTVVRASTKSKKGYVMGFAEAGCKGQVIQLLNTYDPNPCTNFDDPAVLPKSWKSGAPFDESG